MPALAVIADEAELPTDSVELARQRFHVVACSQAEGQVFRVGLADTGATLVDPCDVGRSHMLAVAMGSAGLNVLAPATSTPMRRGRYVVSAFPLAEPLAATGWRTNEPALLGAAMPRWARFSSELLVPLDIPGYTAERLRTAEGCSNGALRAAAEWCHAQRDSLQLQYPWTQLMRVRGCIHGDPNLGNLVRVRSTSTPLFIDLDSVKHGPRWYDLAVMQLYAIRFASSYPWQTIMAAYERADGTVQLDALRGLRRWKEFSSATQLLTRWEELGIAEEFWRRTIVDDAAPWKNVTRTPVEAG